MPPERSHRFDSDALYVRLDRHRRATRIQWRDIARAAGVSPSTLTRLGQGSVPDGDALVSLLLYLGETNIAPYVITTTRGDEL